MIKLENVVLASPEQMEFIIQGMRNSMDSWEKSDSECVTAGYDMEHIFGIYTDKDKAEAAKKVVIEQLYEKDNEWSYVDDISDIEVSVVEIESDMAVDIELGGYCE